jgi:tRNA A-37 threonylcarbamoyl transferase component Bud32
VAAGTNDATFSWSQNQTAGDPAFWQREVDRICDRFEDDWLAGLAPRIEDVLDALPVPASQQAVLLAELLKLERELRQRRGEAVSASGYLPRFPEHAHVVRAVFGEARVGPYEVIGLIGEGGMGTVYRAYDPRFRRTVALKVIRSSRLDDSAAQSRFRLEAQLAARLEHDHIVPVFDAAQDGDRLYYTMRYIQGRNLAEVINRRPIPGRQAARYIEQVARAVGYAHDESVLHRDLKPSNILIDANDRAYVTDFGLAKVLGKLTDQATQSSDRVGTLAYMAPEQARDPTRAVIESDVYSLGATLYEAITGRPPFHAETLVAALERIEKHEPVRPRRLCPAIDRDLETICLKCLDKEREGRYRSAALLADDLRRYLKHEPIIVRPVGPIEVAKKWVRRNPSLAALAAVTVLLLFAVVTAFQTQRLKNRLAEALDKAKQGEDRLAKALDTAKQGEQTLLITYERIIKFGERRLTDRPEDLNKLLELVSDQYGDYLSRHVGNAQFDRQSAQIRTSLARITDLSGSRARALGTYKQALDLWAKLAEGDPTDPKVRFAQADTWHEIGDLSQGLGRSGEAYTAFQKARAIRQRLVDDAPDNRTYWSALARSHGYLGDWERENGQPDAARESYDKALAIRERLSESDSSDLVAKFQLARSYNNSGYLEREAGNLAASISAHTKAKDLQKQLADLDPLEARRQLEADDQNLVQYRDFVNDLGVTYNALGVAKEELSRSLQVFAQRNADGSRILGVFPLQSVPVGELVQGLVATYLGQALEAEDDQKQALVQFEWLLREYPGASRYRAWRAWTLVHLASLSGALADLKKLKEADAEFKTLMDDNPEVLTFRAGAARSLAAQGEILRRSDKPEEGRRLLEQAEREQSELVQKNRNNFDFNRQLDRTQEQLRLQ